MAKYGFLLLICLAVLPLASCSQPAGPPANNAAAPVAAPGPKQAAPAAKELGGNGKTVEFIIQAGTVKLFEGQVEITVSWDDAGTSYTIKKSLGGFESSTARQHDIKKGAAWFIYPESPSKLWVFTGTELLLWDWEKKETDKEQSYSTNITSMFVVPEIVKRAPSAVKERLPREIREKFLEK